MTYNTEIEGIEGMVNGQDIVILTEQGYEGNAVINGYQLSRNEVQALLTAYNDPAVQEHLTRMTAIAVNG